MDTRNLHPVLFNGSNRFYNAVLRTSFAGLIPDSAYWLGQGSGILYCIVLAPTLGSNPLEKHW